MQITKSLQQDWDKYRGELVSLRKTSLMEGSYSSSKYHPTTTNLFRETRAMALYRLCCSTTAKADLWDLNAMILSNNPLPFFFSRKKYDHRMIWGATALAQTWPMHQARNRQRLKCTKQTKQEVNKRAQKAADFPQSVSRAKNVFVCRG